jgi:DNA mismatch endonuclease (patch repair protein)
LSDIFDKTKRSEIMSHIKGSCNTSTEERLITVFRVYGFKGWRRKYKVYGKPDFVFHREKVAVFVDGCFWHGHDCRNTRPKQNEEFWQCKISRNMERDETVTKHLEKLGWTVLRIWECELKKKDTEKLLIRIESVGLRGFKRDRDNDGN